MRILKRELLSWPLFKTCQIANQFKVFSKLIKKKEDDNSY